MKKANKPGLSPNTLREVIEYDPLSGLLSWKPRDESWFNDSKQFSALTLMRTWNRRFAGKRALATIHSNGYLHGPILARHYYAHRAAWAIEFGQWPEDQIDHINGVKTDNRIVNLRCVSDAENRKNMPRPKNNGSGVVGVSWYTPRRAWRARIRHQGRDLHVGYFGSFDEAVSARKQVAKELDFHANHGRSRWPS